jgi:hypothetical protein
MGITTFMEPLSKTQYIFTPGPARPNDFTIVIRKHSRFFNLSERSVLAHQNLGV